MAICATSHALADGTTFIALDASNLNLTTCQMVVITGAEFDNELMNFSPADALQVSGAVGLLWASAWIFKAVRNALSISESQNETE